MTEPRPASPLPSGVLRSVAVACAPGTTAAAALLAHAAAPEVRVSDGERWTAYDAPGLTLALAGPAEVPAGAAVSLNVKVPDVTAALAALVADGAESCGEPVAGAHEVRASVWLAPGVALTVYQPR